MSGEVNVGAIAGSIVLTDETQAAVNSASNSISRLEKRYYDIQQAALVAGKGALNFGNDVETAGDKVKTLDTRLSAAQGGLQKFGSSMRQMGAGMTAAVTLPILGAGAAAIKLGMDAIESENLVAVSFGGMLKAAQDWSKGTSKALGLNEYELRKQSGTLFNMFSSMGLARQGAFDMATGMTKLAADMASFRNISVDEAMVKLRSGIVGMSRPLQDIGILVNENTIKQYAYKAGIAAYGSELDGVQKVQARWVAILDQTKNDQGDLARTMDSPTNKIRIMGEQIKQAGTQLGMVLMPYAVTFIDLLARGAGHLSAWVEAFGKWPEPLKLVALGMLGIAAAVGPLMVGFGIVAGGINNAITLYRTLAAAQVAAGLVTRAAAADVLAQSGMVQRAAEIAGGAAMGWKTKLLGVLGTITSGIGTAMTAVVGFLGWPVTLTIAIVAAGAAVLYYFGLLGPTIDLLKDLGTIVVGVAKWLGGALVDSVMAVVDAGLGFVKWIADAVWSFDKWVASLFGFDLGALVGEWGALFGQFFGAIPAWLGVAWTKIKEWGNNVRQFIKDVADSFRDVKLPEVKAPEGFKTIAEQADNLKLKMVAIPEGAIVAKSGLDKLTEALAEARKELDALSKTDRAKLANLLKSPMSEDQISERSGISEMAVKLFKDQQQAAEKAGKAIRKHADDLAEANSSMRDLSGAQVEAIRYYKAEGDTVGEIAKKLELYDHQVKQVTDSDTKAAKAAKEFAKAQGDLLVITAQMTAGFKSIPGAENTAGFMPSVADIKSNITATEALQQQHYQWLMGQGRVSFDAQRAAVAADTADKLANIDQQKVGWQLLYSETLNRSYDMYDDIERKEKETFAKMKAQEFSWSNSFKMFANGITQNISQALLNGGNVVKAFSATTSQVLGDAGKRAFSFDEFGKGGPLAGLNDKIATGAGKIFGKGFGDAVFTAIPFIGGMIGALAGPLMEKAIGKIKEAFGGPSAKELEGRKAEGSYEAQLAGTLTATQRLQAGTSQLSQALLGLQNQYIGVGMSSTAAAEQAQIDMKRMLDAEKQGSEAVKHVQDEIAARQESMKAVTSGVDDLANAVRDAGGKIPDYLRPAIKSFLDMKNLTDAQRKALEGLLTDAEPDYKKLTEAAAKYGITIGSLGPKFQQADITDRAMQIANDFRDITSAGGDVGAVVTGMSESVNKLVQDAMKYGAAIPEALRPVVENLFNTGRLVDANGNKITDMSKISFAQTPLEKSTDAIVKAIEKLTALFSGMPGVAETMAAGVTDALARIPDETHKKVIFDQEGNSSGNSGVDGMDGGDQPRASEAARGGLVTHSGVQYLAKGGLLASIFRPKGTDTVPAMLSPGERVLSVVQNEAYTKLMSALRGAGSATGPILDAAGSSAGLMQTIGGAIGAVFGGAAKNVDGLGSALKRALEGTGDAGPKLQVIRDGAIGMADALLGPVKDAAAQIDLSQPVDTVAIDWKRASEQARNCWIPFPGQIKIIMRDAVDAANVEFAKMPTMPDLGPYANDWGWKGGSVEPLHLSGGGVAWDAQGSDTIPAMLSPGERVLSVRDNVVFEAGLVVAGRGRTSPASGSKDDASVAVLRRELVGIKGQLAAQTSFFKYDLARGLGESIRDEMQKARK